MKDRSSAAEAEVVEVAAYSLGGDPQVDSQVATAKRYPRSITSFLQRAQEMATLTPEIAASCIYALPRKENGRQKNIEGPSARLAEICASAWGNLRAEGKVLGNDDQYVTARGTAWDVEANVIIAYEVRRRITNRDGKLFNEDMIGVTGNAGASIALRNAILKVIPTPFWKPIYDACRKVVAGDAKTFESRRDAMLHEFAVMGVTEERLCAAFDLKGKADITLDHIATLRGFYTALRDGDTTIEECFPENGTSQAPQPGQRKSQQAETPATATAANTTTNTAPASTTTPAPPPLTLVKQAAPVEAKPNVGLIIDIDARANGCMVKLDTGFRCATRDAETIAGLKRLKEAGTRVELVTVASSDPSKYAPVLDEVLPMTEEPKA